MRYRKLGAGGPEVSEIGFGGWALGGQWGEQDDDTSIRALHRAIELGVTLIDTAAGYGDGRSERVIAEALAGRDENILVATKTPPAAGPWPPSPYCTIEERWPEGYLRENVEERLRNLRTERLDLLQLHTWTRAWNRNPVPFEEAARMKEEGKLGLVGVCTPEQDQNAVVDLIKHGLVDVAQIVLNIFEQEPAAEILPLAQEKGVGVIVRVVFDEGSLTGKYAKGHVFGPDDFRSNYFAGDRLDRTVHRVEKIKADIAEANLGDDYSLADVALKFALSYPAVSAVIPGIRTVRQADMNCSVSDKQDLPCGLLVKLRRHQWLRGVWYSGL